VDALAKTPTVTLPILGTIASWRVTFLIVGLPGLVLHCWHSQSGNRAAAIYCLQPTVRLQKTSFKEAFMQMGLRWQSVVGISAGMIFQATNTYVIIAWAPTYFLRVHGWTAGQAGKALAVIMIAFACTGMYLGGFLSDRCRSGVLRTGRSKVAIISAVGSSFF